MRQSIAEALEQLGERSIARRLVQLLSDRAAGTAGAPADRGSVWEARRALHCPTTGPVALRRRAGLAGARDIAEALRQLGERSIAPQLVQLLSDEQLNLVGAPVHRLSA